MPQRTELEESQPTNQNAATTKGNRRIDGGDRTHTKTRTEITLQLWAHCDDLTSGEVEGKLRGVITVISKLNKQIQIIPGNYKPRVPVLSSIIL